MTSKTRLRTNLPVSTVDAVASASATAVASPLLLLLLQLLLQVRSTMILQVLGIATSY